MAEMTRPRALTTPGTQAAGYDGQRRPPSIASEISLAAVVTAIGRARAYVTCIVTAWGLECVRDDAALLTSELVTNAVRATGITGAAPRRSVPGRYRTGSRQTFRHPQDRIRSSTIPCC
jgi:hypothetical protein